MEGSLTGTCALNGLIVLAAFSYEHLFDNCSLLNLLEKRRKRGKEEDKEEGEGERGRDGWTKGKYFQVARQRMNGVLSIVRQAF